MCHKFIKRFYQRKDQGRVSYLAGKEKESPSKKLGEQIIISAQIEIQLTPKIRERTIEYY